MRKRLFVRNWIRRLLRYLCIPVGFFLVVFPLYSLMIRQTIQAQSSSAMEMLAIGTTQFERCLSNIRSTTNKLFHAKRSILCLPAVMTTVFWEIIRH